MNIIHIGNVGLRANGVGQVIEKLSQAQRNAGHKVTVLTARQKKEALPDFKEIHSIKDFQEIINQSNPDIFIFHSLYIREYIRFYKYLLKRKIPYLIQLHGALSKENYKKNFLKKWIANILFFNRFIKSAKSIIYLNRNEYENSIVKNINPSRIFIPNGCPEAQLRSNTDRKKERIEILYLGRIDFHHKGLDKLIGAIKILDKEGFANKIHFSIYGFGEQDEMDKLKTELTKLDNIAHFYGPIYGEKKNEVYEESDIFILTSRYEGMPMGVLEALSYRLPCIVTEATNMGEVINNYNCGWITEFNDVEIAKTIKNAIIDYQENKTTLNKHCQVASQQFLWSKIGEDSIKLYSKYL